MNKYLLAITCYNCENQVSRVLDAIDSDLENKVEEIMVIDNISTDNTEQVVLDCIAKKRLSKLHLYQNVNNYSLGGSHKVAFLHAIEKGYTHVIILHGDDQAKAEEVVKLIDIVENTDHNTVLGSRFNKNSILQGYDWKRIAGNRVLNIVFSVVSGKHVEDLGSGLNIFAIGDLKEERFLNFADKLTFNFEILLDLLDRKVNFTFCPITWREEDQVSNAKNFNIAWTGFSNLMKWRFTRSKFFTGNKKASDYQTKLIG
ncbi:MAG: glycosyltransferase family 2 protein [Candidatus Ancillula sp.]|jgi:glycosyltransferase involved in cell wall biosynthesis|nr:glycosyltransferase family 2 protein [Candidatus Ancillula sp.]